MHCSRNDVVLLPIPFTDLSSSKGRRAIVVGDGTRPGLCGRRPLTCQLANADFTLASWRAAGLNVPSGVKAQLCTVEDVLVRKIIGWLATVDVASLDQHLRGWLRL